MKGQLVNISGTAGHKVPVAITQLCCCSMIAAMDTLENKEPGCDSPPKNFVYSHRNLNFILFSYIIKSYLPIVCNHLKNLKTTSSLWGCRNRCWICPMGYDLLILGLDQKMREVLSFKKWFFCPRK